jgi:hypothetical protein
MKFTDSGHLMSNELENKISHLDSFDMLETNINSFMRKIVKNRRSVIGSIVSYKTES